jgi:uncharacterized glyoxalase superfamily protein PhnB
MQVQPYLFFSGNCEEALEFYKKALSGGTTAARPHPLLASSGNRASEARQNDQAGRDEGAHLATAERPDR